MFISSAIPDILGVVQSLKVGHVSQATLPCDSAVVRFCNFGLKMPIPAYF